MKSLNRGVVLLCLALLASGCASSRPDAFRRSALLVADEIDAGVSEWNRKLQAEREYYRATEARLLSSYERSIDDGLRLESGLRTDAFLDDLIVEKKGVSLTAMRRYIKDTHEWRRGLEKNREEQRARAKEQASLTLVDVTTSKQELEALEKELRALAGENADAIRRRLLREWAGRIKGDFKALQDASK